MPGSWKDCTGRFEYPYKYTIDWIPLVSDNGLNSFGYMELKTGSFEFANGFQNDSGRKFRNYSDRREGEQTTNARLPSLWLIRGKNLCMLSFVLAKMSSFSPPPLFSKKKSILILLPASSPPFDCASGSATGLELEESFVKISNDLKVPEWKLTSPACQQASESCRPVKILAGSNSIRVHVPRWQCWRSS